MPAECQRYDWIRLIAGLEISFALILIATLGLAGCASKPQPVYVDLAAVQMESVSAPSTGQSLNSGPGLSSIEVLPALPASSLYMGAAQESLDQAREIREKNRERALREIENRLFEAAKADAKREADLAKAALLPGYNESLDSVYDGARGIFETYAEPAGVFRLRLAETVGFPDPDPESRRQPDALDRTAVRRFERAKMLRETLDNLSSMFWNDFNATLDSANSDYRQKLAQVDVEFVQKQDRLIAEAKEKAKEVLDSDGEGPGLTALGVTGHLPAQPSATATVKAPPIPIGTPKPKFPDWKSVQTKQLQDELKIWLSINGYRLATKAEGARNATQEFIVWRKGTRTGL
ncbi:MAG: hypothetical protein K1X67_23495 [Fimbriimonadaceae bacterium]|nr:hypothetical protein [Fimbriimonadaceae bacterium]